jgi:hypothetical protein
MASTLTLEVLPGNYAIARLSAAADIPVWATAEPVFSVSRTAAELSILCPAHCIPADQPAETGFRGMRVCGPLAFSEVGILASLVGPLAEAGISIFSLSTYDTDYLFLADTALDAAIAALEHAGHQFI